jgi:hypothetical protein
MSPIIRVVRHSAFYLLHVGFLLELSFDPEDGATYSSETLGDFQRATQRYIPEDRTVHSHRRENLKSYNNNRNYYRNVRGTIAISNCPLSQWPSTWGMRTPRSTRRNLRGYAKTSYGARKIEYIYIL